MRQYEPFKRLFRIGSAAILMGVITGIYGCVWNGYFNKLIEFPFWRRGNWLMIALYAGLLFFFLMTYGGFRIGYLKKGNLLCSQILSIGLLNVITYIQISLLDKKFHDPKILTAMTLVQLLTAIVWTILFQRLYRFLFPPRKMLLVCGDRPAFHLMEKINSREDKYYLAKAIHIRAGMDAIIREAQEFDALIIGDIPAKDRNALLKKCFERDIRTYTVPKLSDILIRTSEELDIFDSPLLLSRNEDISGMQRFWKRALDVVCSGAGLVVLSPFFLLVALSIYLTDRGPVFYKQTRLTEGGKEFQICKFRTMIQNAEEKSGARLASENDDRILPIGHFLRRTRLDELPQLLNIWKGEMSLVGPRPERPELAAEIEREIPEFCYRLKMKAGLTGYAQIYGKYNTVPYDKLKLDLTYIRNYSFWLDLKLLLMTPKIMMLKESTEGVLEHGKQG
ncbi:exopolysaccharide biosynthesis polyprenyl glycosylphosphotransferase [Clostridium sp. AF02-29]|uniref:exopolysaccharide biosynthesis polyprenyl glycosylphosphotransferase n=3 Tax=unclassified Clostridium TaxID=2614128 RepID=UPI0023540C3B|nr:exopolysaccharide biosynthesis polyprenyl glycosylphosphotransferase [Clostridium sp. AF02-29]